MPLLPRNAREIRASVTGLGKMGSFHVKALSQLSRGESESYYKAGLREQVVKVRICGLCDLDPAKRGALEGIPVFHDHAAMLREVRPDIAIIATPSGSHYELALCALDAGAHTLVEKPATTRAAQWAALVNTAARLDLRIMAGHVERYNPVAIKLHAMLAEKVLRVAEYAFTRCQPHDPRIPDDIVADKLIHDLDLAMFLFGPVARHTLVDFKKVGRQTHELTVHLTHRNGITGELFVSWLRTDAGKRRECRLRRPDGGEVRGDFVAKRLFSDAVPQDCTVPDWVKPDNNQIKDELADFVGYCLMPDPGLPAIQPLLSPAEVGAATAITEQVAREIEKMDVSVRTDAGGD